MNREELEREFERLALEHEEGMVRVTVLKDHGEIVVDGTRLSLQAGKILTLPLWMAKFLEEKGIVESKEFLDFAEVDGLLFEEIESYSLKQIDSEMYARIREKMKQLRKNNSMTSLRELQAIEGMFNQLLQQRLKKILKIAENSSSPASLKNLSPEEKFLHHEISAFIRAWKKSVGLRSSTLEFEEEE